MNKKKKIIFYSVIITLIIVVLFGSSYAYMQFSLLGNKNLVIKSGNLQLTLNEQDAITLNNAYPVTDQVGILQTPSTFSVKNTGTMHSNYSIYLESETLSDGEEVLPIEVIKFNLSKNGSTINQGFLTTLEQDGKLLLDQGLIKINQTNQYELRIWIDQDTTSEHMGKTYLAKLKIVADQLIDSLEQTPEFCFDFNTSTGTITSYDSSCPKNVVIPSQISGVTVKRIEGASFISRNLTSIKIPNTITYIGAEAFNNNMLPDDEAFIYARKADGSIDYTTIVSYGGARKENVRIPDGVTTIGVFAFERNELKSVIFPEGLKTIGDRAFRINKLETLTLPSSVNRIDGGAFADNQLPDDLAFIYNRNSDSSINYESLNSYGGAKRENIVLPSNIKILGSKCFTSVKLDSFTIPDGITTIQSEAFSDSNLRSVVIPSSVTSIAGGAFRNNLLPDDEAFIYKRNADGGIDYTTVVSYGGENKSNVVIPEGVITIVRNAFGWQSITSLTLPSTLQTIESGAITNLQITSLTIPSSVTTMQDNSIYENKKLRKIVNQTGRSFDWKKITSASGDATFVTGIIPHTNGNITVVSE